MELPKRKSTRIKEYDYSQDGTYFITICTQNHKCILSQIYPKQDLETATVELTQAGNVAEQQLLNLEDRYGHIKIDAYVIMPNHVHCLISIINDTESKPISVSNIICTYKSIVARECKRLYKIEEFWQRSFYDHIIRNEKDYFKIFNYIQRNPGNWIYDRYYFDGVFN